MELSFTSGLEITVAVFLVLAVFWVKPEYGLFVYGVSLGFPDAAVPLGTTINLRIDDALIVFFLLRTFLWTPAPLAPEQKKILRWLALLFAVCSVSAAIGFARGVPPPGYETTKMLGCTAIFVALPRLLQSGRRLRFLIAGLMCGGIALVVQMTARIAGSSSDILVNFQEFKNASAFTTWNPNTIGQAAILLVFAAGLGWIAFPHSRFNNLLWLGLATLFTLTPVSVFARGTSLSLSAGYFLFLCLVRRWKLALVFLLISLSAVTYLRSVDSELVDSATRVDLTSGEGFSHRFDRWDMAMEAIKSAPLLGHGFGQEWTLLSSLGSEGRAHDAYMSVWIEIGLGGFILFLAVIQQYVSVGLALYRQPQFHLCGALLLGLIAVMCLDSVGLPTLYWEKLPTIALSIGIALVGLCKRDHLAVVVERAPAAALEALPQRLQA